MGKKVNIHKVTITGRRRENKKTSDMLQKGVSKRAIKDVFDVYYKNPAKALYRAIFRNK